MKTQLSHRKNLITIAASLLCVSFALADAPAGPDRPLGVMGAPDPLGDAFTLLWQPVTQKADRTQLENLAGYNVYRRATPRGVPTKINSYVIPVSVFADRVDGRTFFYSVRAVDQNGNESEESFLVDSSPKANVIFLAADGHTNVTIPGNVSKVLQPAHNKYGVPLTIELREEPGTGDNSLVRSIRLQFLRGDTREEINDVSFASPEVDIHVGYNVLGGQVTIGAPGNQLAESALTNATPDQLCLYWFNGIAWLKLGGSNDRQAQTVGIKSSQLGNFQLRISAPSSALALNKANVFPGLFTPNNDGFNDRVYLILENPNNSSVRGEIFDLAGRYVVTLPAPTQTAGVGTTLAWGGQDSNGSMVPSGLYMYRIEGDGQVITGSVSVAR